MEQDKDGNITLDPLAAYYRNRFHQSEDSNAVLTAQLGQMGESLNKLKEDYKEVQERLDAVGSNDNGPEVGPPEND